MSKVYSSLYVGIDTATSWLGSTGNISFEEIADQLIKTGTINPPDNSDAETLKQNIDYYASEKYGLKWSEVLGQYFINDYNAYITGLEKDLENLTADNASLEERNEISA